MPWIFGTAGGQHGIARFDCKEEEPKTHILRIPERIIARHKLVLAYVFADRYHRSIYTEKRNGI